MFSKLKQSWRNQRITATTLTIVAAICFALGLAFSSGSHWITPSAAQTLPAAPQAAAGPAPAGSSYPGSFAALAARLSPMVVNVKVIKVEKVGSFPSFTFPKGELPDGFRDFFNHFFQDMPRNQQQMPRIQGAGSGVIISTDGYVLTNNHVIEGAKEVTVTLSDHQEYKARIVGRDPKTDLAVLKIEGKGPFPAATLGDSDNLKVGDWVIAIGNPFGLNNTVTSGIVSAKGRVIGAGPYDNFIQTDASINPGNSGGPLFNMQGEVVGINTAIISQGQGIGFAIPVNTVKPLVPQLETKGSVTRGYLGVTIQSITPALAKALKLQDQKGALVADVTPNSPAAKAGVQRGDVIVAYNGKEIVDNHDLPALVAGTPVGEESTVTVLRNGQKMQLAIKVAELPSDRTAANATAPAGSMQPAQGKWGLELQDLTPQLANQLNIESEKGVAVVGVKPGSQADEAGIQQGDVILEVNQQPVTSVHEAIKKMDGPPAKDHLLLLVQRGHAKLFVPLENNIG
jgi:serine protease Do|uniref:Probable periplasmic serine endoprotease DegP-like n=1 Tax=Desulfobacca acetoxidans TaxID=60893 RepID=A0A7V6DQH9_9BACT